MKKPRGEARRWLDQALYDLDTARWNQQGRRFSVACFWAQQTAEKAAKAYLYSRGERLVLGHSVAELLERCSHHEREFDSLIIIGGFLDRFYIPTRYPNGLPGGIPAQAFTDKDAMEAIESATSILDKVKSKILDPGTGSSD